jgi:hypothetical protein
MVILHGGLSCRESRLVCVSTLVTCLGELLPVSLQVYAYTNAIHEQPLLREVIAWSLPDHGCKVTPAPHHAALPVLLPQLLVSQCQSLFSTSLSSSAKWDWSPCLIVWW